MFFFILTLNSHENDKASGRVYALARTGASVLFHIIKDELMNDFFFFNVCSNYVSKEMDVLFLQMRFFPIISFEFFTTVIIHYTVTCHNYFINLMSHLVIPETNSELSPEILVVEKQI